jgi:hypothetical protein
MYPITLRAIKVPLSKEKFINRSALKPAGPAILFVLYSNLPLELRQKILDNAIFGRHFGVQVIEMAAGSGLAELVLMAVWTMP